ncbi:TerC family protein [Fictibacillus iocasae]|uniref:TerC family protein n=1 Tax=Fictibacillus iocasae TaxID=2715437 RepID=A0ABW2NR21_9BACL
MDPDFLLALLQIIAIDILLGGDNAIVIALASRNLPEHQRNKAIFLGTGLAIILRIILTILAVYLLKIPYLYFIGGLMLVYISYQLLVDKEEESSIKPGKNLADAVKTIVFADIAMGLDNVLAIAGAAHGNITLVIAGLIISVPIIIWGSKVILYFLERYPLLVYLGAAVLAFTAAGMITSEKAFSSIFKDNNTVTYAVTAFIILGVMLSGWLRNRFASTKKG